MKIKLSDIKSGFKNKFFDIPTDSIPKRGTTFNSDNINCTLSASVLERNRFKLKGEIEAAILYECVRCLKLFNSKVTSAIDFLVVDKPNDHIKVRGEEIVEIPNFDDEFDISVMIADIVELENPIKPLCDNECLGLCNICGINKNDISCDCKIEKGYGLWENLKKLKTKKH